MNLTPEQYELIRYSGSYLMDQCGVRYTRKRKYWPKVTDKFEFTPEIRAELDAKRSKWNEPPMRPTLGIFGAPLGPEKGPPVIRTTWFFWILVLHLWWMNCFVWTRVFIH